MTLIEASRRKVFLILLLFAAALMSSAAFFPIVDVVRRLRLMEIWALRASAIFTAIVALFMTAFSLPSEFEEKRIYLLASKPVSKGTIFLGKFVGFTLLLTIFVGAMGAITVGFIRTVQLFGGENFPVLAAYPRVESDKFGGDGAEPAAKKGREDWLVISGNADNNLRWSFEELDPSDYPDPVRMEIRFFVGSPVNLARSSDTIRFDIAHPEKKANPHTIEEDVNTNEEKIITFPRDLIGADGRLDITVFRTNVDSLIASAPAGIILMEKSASFELNYAKGLLLTLLQSMMILAITLMASTFLSAPVSIILGLMLYMVGTMHGFVLDGARSIETGLSQIRVAREQDKKPPRTPEDLPEWLLEVSTVVSVAVLKVVPDFEHFDFSRHLRVANVFLVSQHELTQTKDAGVTHCIST